MFTPALFSVSYAGLWGQAALSLPDFVRHAADVGYRHVMIAGKRPHLSPLDFHEKQVDSLQKAMEVSGITAPVIGAYVDAVCHWLCQCELSQRPTKRRHWQSQWHT